MLSVINIQLRLYYIHLANVYHLTLKNKVASQKLHLCGSVLNKLFDRSHIHAEDARKPKNCIFRTRGIFFLLTNQGFMHNYANI